MEVTMTADSFIACGEVKIIATFLVAFIDLVSEFSA
jgi:hypothetical protein